MASITTDNTTAGFVPRGFVFGVGSTAQTTVNNLQSDVDSKHGHAGLQLSVLHVTAVSNTDSITEEIYGAVACAWQPEDASDDGDVSVVLTLGTAVGASARKPALFTFVGGGGTEAGWIWVLHAS